VSAPMPDDATGAHVDHYALLGVAPGAAPEEIEHAYHEQMRAWSPANYGPGSPREILELAEERTRLLIAARQELADPDRRRAYDLDLARADGRGSVAAAGRGRVIAWLAFAGLLAVLGLAIGFSGVEGTGEEMYWWSTGIVELLGGAVLLAIVLWITPGIRVRDVVFLRRPRWPRDALGLRRPTSWRLGLGAGAALIVGSFVFAAVYDTIFGPFEPDPTMPGSWDGSRAPQFLLSLIVVAVVVPVQEELLYRGVGYSLLARWGTWAAIAIPAVLFALAHGFLELLPFFLAAGLGFGILRRATGSVLPGIVTHGVFNAMVTVLAVTAGG
jgi:membrane protease YdiL (CAAX protease family)